LSVKNDVNVQGGSDKSGILKIFLENHSAQLKSSDFIEVKKYEQRGILRINLCNEMAVSGADSLNPRPEPLAGLRHGVPVKGPHLRLHLLDKVLNFL
jgi:hypothetical protein